MICRLAPGDEPYTPEKMLADARTYIEEHAREPSFRKDLRQLKGTNPTFGSIIESLIEKEYGNGHGSQG